MRKIEFIAPVEAMRGNITRPGQRYFYGGSGDAAWDVQSDAYANDYGKIYVGAKTSAGKCHFSLRNKTKVVWNSDTRLAASAFGGACSLANKAYRDLMINSTLVSIYQAKRVAGKIPSGVFITAWLVQEFRPMLAGKQASVTISEGSTSITINNPWVDGGTGHDVTIPADILSKFNTYLSA